jgi:hypothetical protein
MNFVSSEGNEKRLISLQMQRYYRETIELSVRIAFSVC